ncbi:hypothetical protein N2152v2_003056 [Parachlorella kessleri]
MAEGNTLPPSSTLEGMPCLLWYLAAIVTGIQLYGLAGPVIMLLSDGSVTRHLQLMTDQRVQVECLEMRNIGEGREGLPSETELIQGPLVQRQVFLHIPDPHSKAYVYATSWWNAEEGPWDSLAAASPRGVDGHLMLAPATEVPQVEQQQQQRVPTRPVTVFVLLLGWCRDKSQPIWVSLSRGRAELYREILAVEYGNSPYLEERFQSAGPFWGRSYLFWRNGRPLTLIYEVFSTALQELLGPMKLDDTGDLHGSVARKGVEGSGLVLPL